MIELLMACWQPFYSWAQFWQRSLRPIIADRRRCRSNYWLSWTTWLSIQAFNTKDKLAFNHILGFQINVAYFNHQDFFCIFCKLYSAIFSGLLTVRFLLPRLASVLPNAKFFKVLNRFNLFATKESSSTRISLGNYKMCVINRCPKQQGHSELSILVSKKVLIFSQ